MTTEARRWIGASVALIALSACQSGPAASTDGDGRRVTHADIAGVADARGLVRESKLVVIGIPGEPRVHAVLDDGSTDYVQSVAVEHVLKGDAGPTIAVIRNGQATDQGESDSVQTSEEGTRGPLPERAQVLFLIVGGEPDTWSVTGHVQGTMTFEGGRVSDSEFEILNGKTRAQLEEFIRREG